MPICVRHNHAVELLICRNHAISLSSSSFILLCGLLSRQIGSVHMDPQHKEEQTERPVTASQRADVLDLVDAGFRYAFSLTHHREDAEDLVQQACLKVVRTKGCVVEGRYWFVTIRNLFLDRCRRGSLISFSTLNEQPHLSDSCTEHRTVDSRLDLETILGTLPVEQRELLYLNCIEGFTADEIGEITGQPRGTILSKLARAKQKLALRFSGDLCGVPT